MLFKWKRNKPSWNTAPSWAHYLAQDATGVWAWYEYEPVQISPYWSQQILTYRQQAGKGWFNLFWKTSLESRPN